MGKPWKSMGNHGNPWKSMEIHGKTMGNPWENGGEMLVRTRFSSGLAHWK